jgi:hypothetical protein
LRPTVGIEVGARGRGDGLRLAVLGLGDADVLVGGVGLRDQRVQRAVAVGVPPGVAASMVCGAAVFQGAGFLVGDRHVHLRADVVGADGAACEEQAASAMADGRLAR